MGKKNKDEKVKGVTVDGKVIETFPNALFKVQLENGCIVSAHASGKLRQNSIKILPEDQVVVELSIYDLTKGRIVFRK